MWKCTHWQWQYAKSVFLCETDEDLIEEETDRKKEKTGQKVRIP